ncbi:MAG: hypothetical protein IPJ00_17285 [Saprospirales bacterium]|nr:hypothetical protein [Saprospirales bacterium]
MFEIERQVREAPDICVICQYVEADKRVHIARFENESGEVLAYPWQAEFRRILAENFKEVAGAVSDCYEEAEKALGKIE